MSQAEDFLHERQSSLFAWDEGPVVGSVNPAGQVEVTRAVEGDRNIVDIDPQADAVLYLTQRRTLAQLRIRDNILHVMETGLSGRPHDQKFALPHPVEGPWSLTDVVEGTDEAGENCVVLRLEDDGGAHRFHAISSGSVHTFGADPWSTTQLLHWDLASDAAVFATDGGPLPPRLHLVRLSSGHVRAEVDGRWLDGQDGTGVLLGTDDTGEPVLRLWDLLTGDTVNPPAPSGHIDDARLLRGTPSRRLTVVSTSDGSDRLSLSDPDRGTVTDLVHGRSLPARLRFRLADDRGVGLYGFGNLSGSAWVWVDRDESVSVRPGRIPPHTGNATRLHTRLRRTPALVFTPETPPSAMVVSLHGGPESMERDELRWDGLYRELLDAGVMVVGLNYQGSIGYGAEHRRRPWGSWREAFQEDLESCVGLARERGVPPERLAFLGGSFGGALAILACALDERVAGAVACAPLIDLREQVGRAVDTDPRYRAWFEERFVLSPDPETPHPLFSPEELVARARRPVHLIHGDSDEVIDCRGSESAVKLARENGHAWTLVLEEDVGHVPVSGPEAEQRYSNVLAALGKLLPFPERSRTMAG